jgi:hypothetical protein
MELDNILHNESNRQNMIKEYSDIKDSLGEPGAAERAAKSMISH